jgi:ATP-dependent Lon protease
MFMAMTSLVTKRTVRSDTAMTGEISLRGLVLPIGGVKEKVLAAIQAGIATVMLPARNRKDLEDVPEKARGRIRFVWLERVDDAVEAALNSPLTNEQDLGEATQTASTERRAARSQ